MITLALPSKGRLKENAIECLSAIGLNVLPPADPRSYRAKIEGRDDIEIAYLSASEIAREVAAGNVEAGVTGEDLVRENIPDSYNSMKLLAKLGFGGADVIVAVPDSWFDVHSMADLGEVAAGFKALHGRRLRIATKYWQLTQQFFSNQHGIQLYRIIESLGATEGAPAAGQADIIVDITSTGSTLRANALRVLDDGVILASEACLFAGTASAENPLIIELAEKLSERR
jgi:ATP phosphoribosyltransferase